MEEVEQFESISIEELAEGMDFAAKGSKASGYDLT